MEMGIELLPVVRLTTAFFLGVLLTAASRDLPLHRVPIMASATVIADHRRRLPILGQGDQISGEEMVEAR